MPKLVECVPNVSEGRRGDVIDRMADAIRATEGVRLLDRTSDVDHNRSVFTYAGEPDAVVRATHTLIDHAYREVDMNTHKGEHPRLGAVDVLPFVPLAGMTLAGCVQLAHRFGREVARRRDGRVYLDATAASLATVWREVGPRAGAAGVTVLRGEPIGVNPLDAVLQVAADSLKLDAFTRDRVIESHFLE